MSLFLIFDNIIIESPVARLLRKYKTISEWL